MQLLIVRHAIAEDPLEFAASGRSDDLRPLTPKGILRMGQGAAGIKQIMPELDLLASSHLTRAVQTADILANHYPQAKRLELAELNPGASPLQLARYLSKLPPESRIALVGHEPDLAELIAWLAIGSTRPFLRMKKGAACLLESPALPTAGSSTLLWSLTPRQLRQLGAP